MGDPPHAVAHARDLDDHVEGRRDLGAHGLGRQVDARQADHVLQPGQGLAGPVGVDRAERAVVARVHGLQHVDGLAAAHLAQDDPVGAHAQGVLHQVAHGDVALAFQVGRPRFQPHHVGLLELQLGGVLDGDDALVVVDHLRHGVQERRLARSGAAGDQDVELTAGGDLEQDGHRLGDVLLTRHHVEGDPLLGELADRDGRAVDRQRRNDDVDAAAVLQTGVHHRRGLVDPPPDLRDDAPRHVQYVRVVTELHAGQGKLSTPLDIDLGGAIDQDVGDRLIGEQRLQGAQTQHVVEQQLHHRMVLGSVQADLLFLQKLGDDLADLERQFPPRQLRGRGQIETLHDQRLDARFGVFDRRLVRGRRLPAGGVPGAGGPAFRRGRVLRGLGGCRRQRAAADQPGDQLAHQVAALEQVEAAHRAAQFVGQDLADAQRQFRTRQRAHVVVFEGRLQLGLDLRQQGLVVPGAGIAGGGVRGIAPAVRFLGLCG